jgi:hypothetical protein
VTNDEFVNKLSTLGFTDVTIGLIFRDEHPRGVIRYTHDHKLELCFYNHLREGRDFTRVFNRCAKSKVIEQIEYTLRNTNDTVKGV